MTSQLRGRASIDTLEKLCGTRRQGEVGMIGRGGICMMGALFLALAVQAQHHVEAGILSKLMREAGEAGGKAGRHGLDSLDNATSVLKRLPDSDEAAALAVHATPEGHWTFSNRNGETFTAASPQELSRMPDALLERRAEVTPLKLFLTEDTVFKQASRIDELPKKSRLFVVSDRKSYALRRSGNGNSNLFAEVRPDVLIALNNNRKLFTEALFRLNRALNPANIRVLTLQPGGPKKLSSVGAYDPKSGRRSIEAVDPDALAAALTSLRGQTVIVSGNIRQGLLKYTPVRGSEQTLDLETLRAAARQADVNLIVLKSSSPRQPGGETLLWQTVGIPGLEDGLKNATFADFLHALSGKDKGLTVTASETVAGRVRFEALPNSDSVVPLGDQIGTWIGDAVSEITGNLVIEGIEVAARDKKSEREHDLRLFSWLPSEYQFLYLGAMIAGVLGLALARAWWQRLWPSERREDYRNAFGFHAARLARLLIFLLIFLPVVGLPAFLCTYLVWFASILFAPFRFLRWLYGRLTGRSRKTEIPNQT